MCMYARCSAGALPNRALDYSMLPIEEAAQARAFLAIVTEADNTLASVNHDRSQIVACCIASLTGALVCIRMCLPVVSHSLPVQISSLTFIGPKNTKKSNRSKRHTGTGPLYSFRQGHFIRLAPVSPNL